MYRVLYIRFSSLPKVPVQISPSTKSSPGSVLPPQPVGRVRILVPVRVHHRQEIPVDVPYALRLILVVVHELVDDVRDRRGRYPLPGVDSSVYPDGLVARFPVRKAQQFQGFALDGGADCLDAAQVRVRLGQVVQVAVDV